MGELLRLGDLSRRHLFRQQLTVFHRTIALVFFRWRKACRRDAEPFVRLDIVLRHAFACAVDDAEIVLRFRIALVRRHAIPFEGFRIVARDALTIGVHEAYATRRFHVALLGGHAVPLHRFGVIAPGAFTVVIHGAEIVVGAHIALL